MRVRIRILLVVASLIYGDPALAADADGDSPPPPPPPVTVDLSDPPLVGYKDGLLYARDPRDFVRLYPHAQLDLDAHGSFGGGASSVSAETAGVNLAPRFFVRHARFDLAGEIMQRISFDGGIELVANPAIDGSRANGLSTEVALADAWAELNAGRGLGVWVGVFQAPFSLENRTAATELPMMERNLAIRGFVAPGGGKALGAAIVGSTQHQVWHWEAGGFGAETVDPDDFEQHFDGIGRLVYTPWGDVVTHPLHGVELGVSGRVGTRLARDVSGDMPAITTGQGFALWRPTYTDASGRLVDILPDSLQWGTGLELRVPFHGVIVQGEGYWMSKGTREAYDGVQSTSTERTGTLQGVGWYGEISWWILQSLNLIAELPPPRTAPHADHLEVATTAPLTERSGFELAALVSGINATYDGAARGGIPSAAGSVPIELYQVGIAASYWQSEHLRLTVNADGYEAPNSSATVGGATVVPGNLGRHPPAPGSHAFGDLGARVSVMF